MRHSYDFLLVDLFACIGRAPRCDSLDAAHELLITAWLAVNQQRSSPPAALEHICTRRMCAEQGWQNLEGDPCRKESDNEPGVWINLHRDGSIVFERMLPAGGSVILFAHPGVGSR